MQSDGDLYLGMFNEHLQKISDTGSVHRIEDLIQTDVWSLLKDRKERIWAGTSSGLFRSADGESFKEMFIKELPNRRVTSLYEDVKGNIYIGHREGITVAYSDSELFHYGDEMGFDGKRVRAIEQSVDGAIWAGAQNGLFRIEDDWILKLDERNGLNDNTIYSIQDDPFGRLWVGAKNGLHILKDDSVLQVMLSGRVDANNINFLHCSSRGYLYVGTNQGLFTAEVLEDIDQMKFRQFGIEDGLPGLECNLNAVYQNSDGDIWFGTNKGVVRFSEQQLIKTAPLVAPVLHITGIRLFAEPFDISARSQGVDSETGLPQGLVFDSKENHITIDFKGIRMKEPRSISYQYYMEGLDEDWLNAGNVTSVTYSSLGFGEYCFRVRCVDQSGSVIGDERELKFRIKAPMFLQWWALIIESILLASFILGIAYWRRSVRKRKNRMIELSYRNRMQSLEQQSLNSSMNRHFIFNSLNAIQFYINREDKRAANRYLSSFAKLIRKNLDSTASTWVSLKDELERLNLYLSLEHMRFKDKFEYHFEIDDAIDSESVRVPAMMLQPFVENSIWHGILPKNERGEVKVNVSRVNGRMRIRIEDDGIGIDVSRDQKGEGLPDHESKGMDITHHRLRLYGEMTGSDFEIVGPDQIEENGQVLGTRIDVYIPIVKT
ncbi:MAG: histidine kinase [Flavobacteriales bacterium]|nr:histidine kinase [Flavobacteriales bacterium]